MVISKKNICSDCRLFPNTSTHSSNIYLHSQKTYREVTNMVERKGAFRLQNLGLNSVLPLTSVTLVKLLKLNLGFLI